MALGTSLPFCVVGFCFHFFQIQPPNVCRLSWASGGGSCSAACGVIGSRNNAAGCSHDEWHWCWTFFRGELPSPAACRRSFFSIILHAKEVCQQLSWSVTVPHQSVVYVLTNKNDVYLLLLLKFSAEFRSDCVYSCTYMYRNLQWITCSATICREYTEKR